MKYRENELRYQQILMTSNFEREYGHCIWTSDENIVFIGETFYIEELPSFPALTDNVVICHIPTYEIIKDFNSLELILSYTGSLTEITNSKPITVNFYEPLDVIQYDSEVNLNSDGT